MLVSQTSSVHYETNYKNKILLVIDGYKFCSSAICRDDIPMYISSCKSFIKINKYVLLLTLNLCSYSYFLYRVNDD